MEGLTGRGDRCPQASLSGSTRPASAGLQMLGHGPRILLSPVSPPRLPHRLQIHSSPYSCSDGH